MCEIQIGHQHHIFIMIKRYTKQRCLSVIHRHLYIVCLNKLYTKMTSLVINSYTYTIRI